MKITKQEIASKIEAATNANKIGWLDTEKMNSQGIKTSKPLCCTGYVKSENPFYECQIKRPRW